MTITYEVSVYKTKKRKLMKKLNEKYTYLTHKAKQATGIKEAAGLIHKAAKLKSKFD